MRNDNDRQDEHSSHRLPDWLKKTKRDSGEVLHLKRLLRDHHLHTVCQSAGCPNISECFQQPTATFMILGDRCTRNCRFCGVSSGRPDPVDENEPVRVAETAALMGLKHVVITSVTRDDLKDGGAYQFARTVEAVHRLLPDASVEVLVPDFQGVQESLKTVLESRVDVLNHNVETIPRLYRKVRPEAEFTRSLQLIRLAGEMDKNVLTKSGLMVGLGETFDEVIDVFGNLIEAGCDALTIGQYLSPSLESTPVIEYVRPESFEAYRRKAEELGFRWVASGPFVRSSYHAHELIALRDGETT